MAQDAAGLSVVASRKAEVGGLLGYTSGSTWGPSSATEHPIKDVATIDLIQRDVFKTVPGQKHSWLFSSVSVRASGP